MELIIILFLILLNGIFSMSEIAMVSSRKVRLEKAAKKGDKTAKKALELVANPGKFFSTVQIGITLIGILTGIYSGEKIQDDFQDYLMQFSLLQPYSDKISVTIIVVVLTYFTLVLGELVPKRIGLTMPETIARIFAYPMYYISLATAPFIWLLTSTTEVILKILGIRKSKDSAITEEEIKAIIREATQTGAVQEIEQDIVENVFHLGDRRINTLMTQRQNIDWIDINEPAETIKAYIAASVHKSFPVCNADLDKVMGVIYSKEILNSLLKNEPFEISNYMKPALFLPMNTTAYKALEKLRESKRHLALAVDEFGGVQGILTMNDLVDALVGDLDEQLHEKKEIIPRDDGSYLVDAALPLPEFARYFEIETENDEVMSKINTVGGLVFHFERRIPHAGDKFKWYHLSIEIVDMDGRRIDKVLVREMSVNAADDAA